MKSALAAFALLAASTAQGAITDRPLSDKACYAAARDAVTVSKFYDKSWEPATIKQFELRMAGRKGVLPLTEGQMFDVRNLLDGLPAQEHVWKDVSIALSDEEFWGAKSAGEILMRRMANKDNCLDRVERVLTQASLHRWQSPRPDASELIFSPPNPNAPQQCALKAAEVLENMHFVMSPKNPNYFTVAHAFEKLRIGGPPLEPLQAQIAAAYATAPAGPGRHADIWPVTASMDSFRQNCERQIAQRLQQR